MSSTSSSFVTPFSSARLRWKGSSFVRYSARSVATVSQALRKLKRQLGVVLAHRTSRSVRLTEAGERLYAGVRPALDEVRATVAAVGELATREEQPRLLQSSANCSSWRRPPSA